MWWPVRIPLLYGAVLQGPQDFLWGRTLGLFQISDSRSIQPIIFEEFRVGSSLECIEKGSGVFGRLRW
jgi:hypothetical protein